MANSKSQNDTKKIKPIVQSKKHNHKDIPIFLGVCHKAHYRLKGLVQDLYGVTDYLPIPFFPFSLNGLLLLFAWPKAVFDHKDPLAVIVRERDTGREAKNEMSAYFKPIEETPMLVDPSVGIQPYKQDHDMKQYKSALIAVSQENSTKMIPVPCPNLFLSKPVDIDVFVKIGETEHKTGSFTCPFVNPAPMTEQERAAIMSRPDAMNIIVIQLRCNSCKDTICFHLALDGKSQPRDTHSESIPIQEATNEWRCKCGQQETPLCYLKQGMHHLFRTLSSREPKQLGFIAMYEVSSVSAILANYQKLLIEHEDGEEEIFQKYIEENPMIWNFLAPILIWKKPRILTKYKADFAILGRMNVLYFVEIEKPKTTLIKKGGGVHAQLQAALDQIRDWRIEIDKRREAVLSSLELEQRDVHDIRYIIVAGLAQKTGTVGMEKVRRMKTDADSILCFDELASFLHSTKMALIEL
jgi:hypothetical protein